MTQYEQARLEARGFTRLYAGTHLTGERLWWKRTGSALDIVRQRDGKTKHQDIGEGHHALPREDDAAGNRRWAVGLAADACTDWQTA
jgi:hypothetical protein